ncbi:MAG: hypothetical protein ACK5OI_15025 [Curvibacter sp.]|jgi:hypothetical protein
MSNEALPTALPQGRLQGRTAFQQAVRDALLTAGREGWREIIVCDASFADWPLGERAVAKALQDWSRSGRRFVMLAMGYEGLPRWHARFVIWRQTWDHIIECRTCRGSDASSFPSVFWGPSWVMQRVDTKQDVLLCDHQAARRVALRQLLDECHRDSSPGFPASVLGL